MFEPDFIVAPHTRPLFIPLRAEFFDAFESGAKTDELRRYGNRWNERTCAVGRPVVISRGYGRQRRITGRVAAFKRQHGSTFGSTYRSAIERVFGTLNIWIACIGIGLDVDCPAGTGRRGVAAPLQTRETAIKEAGASSPPVPED